MKIESEKVKRTLIKEDGNIFNIILKSIRIQQEMPYSCDNYRGIKLLSEIKKI